MQSRIKALCDHQTIILPETHAREERKKEKIQVVKNGLKGINAENYRLLVL